MYPQNLQTSTDLSNRENNESPSKAFPVNFSRITILFFLVIAALLGLQSCQDNNFVGSSFIPDSRNVVVDTIFITDFQPTNLKSFTGNLTRFTAGRYRDELFGTIESTAYVKPGLISDTVAISNAQEFYLRLRATDFYGDTTAVASLELHLIDNRWRASLINADTTLSTSLFQEGAVPFSVSMEQDSVDVRLPQSWVDRYIDIFESDNRQERLLNEEFGFAIKPVNGFDQLLVGFRTGPLGARLIVKDLDLGGGTLLDENGEEEEENTDIMIPLRGWAFNVLQTNTPAQLNEVLPVYNTFQNAVRIGVDLKEYLNKNVTRVELVMYEDSLALNSTLPTHHKRLRTDRLALYQLSDFDRDFLVIATPTFATENRGNQDRSFRVSLTDTIRRLMIGGILSGDFYLTSQFNNGLLFPYALVHPENDQQIDRRPKLIITYLKAEVN